MSTDSGVRGRHGADASVARGGRTLVVRAPTRIDFGGGWTDVPPYDDEQGGCVCNVAITRHATVHLAEGGGEDGGTEPAPLAMHALRRAAIHGARATIASDFPVGAGLGGSSAVGVAMAAACAAWRGDAFDLGEERRARLAEWSRAVEAEDLGIAGGRQDHYAAAFGGALRLDFEGGARVRVTRLPLTPDTRAALERRLVVVYTGESRISADTITAVLDAYRARERRVVDALARMKALAAEMAAALAAGDVDALGALLDEHWRHQRALDPGITTARIDALVARGAAAGAIGAKALGASGGGCVALIAAEGREGDVRAAAAELGEVLAVGLDEAGAAVVAGA